jgi:uncharacterized protein DUF6263
LKKVTAAFLIIIFICVIMSCDQGQKSILLSYKFFPDTKLAYEQIMHREVTVTENDSIIKNYTTSVKAVVNQTISDILEDGSATINEIDTWYFETPSKEDSSKIEKKEMSRELKLKAQPNGKVYDIIFNEEQDVATREYIKSIYEQGMPEFPANKISPGESWTQSTKVVLPDGTTMQPSTTYKFKEIKREKGYNCAVIDCEGTLVIPLVTDPKDTTMRTGVDNIMTTGTIYFAIEEGMTVLLKEHWIIDGKRKRLYEGKMTEYLVKVDTESEYVLTKYVKP